MKPSNFELDAIQDFLDWLKENVPRRKYSMGFLYENLGKYRSLNDK